MKTEIPAGDYHITLEHHPNQQEGFFIATIEDGEYQGKGFPYRSVDATRIDPFYLQIVRTFRKGRNEN